MDVLLADGVSGATIDSLNSALGTRTLRPPRPDSGFFAYRLELPRGVDPLEVTHSLYRAPGVVWADEEQVGGGTPYYVPTDPYYYLQFHLRSFTSHNFIPVDINIEPAWDLTRGVSSVRVTVIDDGVDIQQSNGPVGDLGGGQFAGAQAYDLMSAYASGDNAWAPCCDDVHGTAAAGVIAATQNNGYGGAGIAPGVVVNSVRIFRHDESAATLQAASNAQKADAINYAWQGMNSSVINNSWGGIAVTDQVTTAIKNALANGRGGKGTVVVFAAGNSSNRAAGYVGLVTYPASLSATTNVISVGALDPNGNVANYSPDGISSAPIDVVAPSGFQTGHCIGSVVTIDLMGTPGCNDGPNGDPNATTTFSGTSAAAAEVSGVAALMLSYDPTLTAAQVKSRLKSSADPWGSTFSFGAGKVNAYRALTQ